MKSAALEALGITRYCCRRMLISHVDFIHKILTFTPQESSTIDHSSSKFRIDSEIEGPPTTSFNNELTFTDDDSPRYDVEGSPTYVSFRNRFDLSPRTPIDASIISRDQSLLSRYVQSESSSRYSHNEGNFSESSPGQINQSFPVYELSSYTDDGSPTYEASYQSEQIGDNCSPRYLPEHEQTNDDDSSRYSPYDF
ncbi:16483_t:CDS:2 [Funneliformis geosporum]|uniref:DNA-directed RNA polymerases I, II, and III subunit RPABC5 n=1 Tax=Funneliformis geosporum TaxID=1117311 RepID=A0A9W4SYM0_9GLOM|nr:16445_t:CDS:2 [Funneliformis geosporum]CAI2186449.1 16483_t:CDS:2 [Funneliformis geosporum]